MPRPSLALAALAVGSLAVTTALASSGPAAGAESRHAIPRTASTWVSHTTSHGRAAPNATSTFRVYLAPHGGTSAVADEVARLNDPASASYRQWLTAAQYHARFDPTDAETATVTDWLSSQHLSVTSVEAHRRYLEVRGTNADVENAFATTIDTFTHDGQAVQANTTALSAPADVAPLVTTVTGLDTSERRITHFASAPAGSATATPCSTYYAEKSTANVYGNDGTRLPAFHGTQLPWAVCGYTGARLRPAYEGGSALTGAGVTVAIVDAYGSPTMASDAATYAGGNGDAPYAPGQYTEVLPAKYSSTQSCGPQGWWGEQSLDVEAVHAMAGGANIRYYGAASCNDPDFLATLGQVVDDNVASLVSNSWGDLSTNTTPDSVAAYGAIFAQGATQGIGFLFSSGDDGNDSASGPAQTEYPTSDPAVTSVGGTSDGIGASGQFVGQTGWETDKATLSGGSWTVPSFLYGAGGGSSTFPKPSYQSAADVPGGTRQVPDVGLDADPSTGFLVGQTQRFKSGPAYGEYRIGGTSLAAPLMAGMSALTTQAAGTRLGQLNPIIYSHRAAFQDVDRTSAFGQALGEGNARADFVNGVDAGKGYSYSVRTFDEDSALKTTPGWDDVTGVGSPRQGWTTAGVTTTGHR